MADMLLNENIGKLGFGFMRLPEKDGGVDYEPMKQMVDTFLDAGFRYFDTAYIYNGSEEALRETLVKRHPRDRYSITTKMPTFMMNKPEDMQAAFDTSLQRLGVDYVDFYLMHALSLPMNDKLEKLGAWEFLKKLKTEGKIRHYGFSFHDTPEHLDTILTRHPDAELVQLQINYLDWENPEVRSKGLYETARKHGIPISIMEPVKGGLLAGDGSQAEAVFKAKNPDVSAASWAVRFAASLEGVLVMLSGMNTMEQLQDNIKTVWNLKPLSGAELQTVKEAIKAINSVPRVPCTSCRYCVENCPQKLNIPYLLHLYSDYLAYKSTAGSGMPFMEATFGGRFPSTCIACRVCEDHCPQRINISDIMAKLVPVFEL